MAQFMLTANGKAGGIHRVGTKKSGVRAHVAGWNLGIRVLAAHRDGKDVFQVFVTDGSALCEPDLYLGHITEGEPFCPSDDFKNYLMEHKSEDQG